MWTGAGQSEFGFRVSVLSLDSRKSFGNPQTVGKLYLGTSAMLSLTCTLNLIFSPISSESSRLLSAAIGSEWQRDSVSFIDRIGGTCKRCVYLELDGSLRPAYGISADSFIISLENRECPLLITTNRSRRITDGEACASQIGTKRFVAKCKTTPGAPRRLLQLLQR
ncbi:hypothetical protein Tcan_13459 [Toxocara canis]|uniref:Uncharacterized protein n=1 Tax=Toxocara canis TaxID=6265 RepID=A0A0B2VII4_TOXCA|nr:hypothetical protein Tcan_13459 [Toxocara canis]